MPHTYNILFKKKENIYTRGGPNQNPKKSKKKKKKQRKCALQLPLGSPLDRGPWTECCRSWVL